MMLPLWVCQHCGRYGGLGLSFSQITAKSAKGETIEKGNPYIPTCEDGHGEMYEVKEGDRLHVLDAVMEVRKE